MLGGVISKIAFWSAVEDSDSPLGVFWSAVEDSDSPLGVEGLLGIEIETRFCNQIGPQ